MGHKLLNQTKGISWRWTYIPGVQKETELMLCIKCTQLKGDQELSARGGCAREVGIEGRGLPSVKILYEVE